MKVNVRFERQRVMSMKITSRGTQRIEQRIKRLSRFVQNGNTKWIYRHRQQRHNEKQWRLPGNENTPMEKSCPLGQTWRRYHMNLRSAKFLNLIIREQFFPFYAIQEIFWTFSWDFRYAFTCVLVHDTDTRMQMHNTHITTRTHTQNTRE